MEYSISRFSLTAQFQVIIMLNHFALLDHNDWYETLPSVRLASLDSLANALKHLEDDDDIVSRSWRILHRAILDEDPIFRQSGLRSMHHSIVSWRDPYFHHNPAAIDRLVRSLTTVALGDLSLRTRCTAIDTIGGACVALSEHLSDAHPKDSTDTITHIANWIVGRLISCVNHEQTHGWTAAMSCQRVHLLYALGVLYSRCGDYLNNSTKRNKSLYTTVLYLLHDIVKKGTRGKNKKKKAHAIAAVAAVTSEAAERPYEDRAVFYILNHCLEDDLMIGQLFIGIAQKKGQSSISPYSRSEILSFLGVWLSRSRTELEMSKDIAKMIELRTCLNGALNMKHLAHQESMHTSYLKNIQAIKKKTSKHQDKLQQILIKIRHVLRIPGTRASLQWLRESSDEHGLSVYQFETSSLFLPFPKTRSISISLPVKSSSSQVILSLLPNSIQNVPFGCTTVPPVLSKQKRNSDPIVLPLSMIHPHVYPSNGTNDDDGGKNVLFGGLSSALQLGYQPTFKENYIANAFLDTNRLPANASFTPLRDDEGNPNMNGATNLQNGQDMNLRYMDTHVSKHWKKIPVVDTDQHRSSRPGGRVVSSHSQAKSILNNIPTTDFPIDSMIEIEVIDPDTQQRVYYIGRVLTNGSKDPYSNELKEHSEVNYDTNGNAHLIIGSIFYISIETTERYTNDEDEDDNSEEDGDTSHQQKNEATKHNIKKNRKKKGKGKGKKREKGKGKGGKQKKIRTKKKKIRNPRRYVHRTLKMIVIDESEKDGVGTLLTYMYPAPKEPVKSVFAQDLQSGAQSRAQSGATAEGAAATLMMNNVQYHLPVNYPTTKNRSMLLPHPDGFTKNGQPFYYDPASIDKDNTNKKGQQPIPIGYTTLGHPLYLPQSKLGENDDDNGDQNKNENELYLPSPVGYTTKGVPYYSAYEIVKNKHYHGLMKLQPLQLNFLEEQQRMEALLLQTKLASEKAIQERQENEHLLHEKMIQLQKEMEMKQQQMNVINKDSNEEKEGAEKNENVIIDETEMFKLRQEMKDAELQMKRLQQEQNLNERKRREAEQNLINAEISLDVVQTTMNDNNEENEEGKNEEERIKEREEAARKKREDDEERVNALNERMEAALLSNDTIG